MNAWDIEEKADHVMDGIMWACEQHLTPEERVDFLMYLAELLELGLKITLIDVGKRSH